MLKDLFMWKVKFRERATNFIRLQSRPENLVQLSIALGFTTFQKGGRMIAVTGTVAPWKLKCIKRVISSERNGESLKLRLRILPYFFTKQSL